MEELELNFKDCMKFDFEKLKKNMEVENGKSDFEKVIECMQFDNDKFLSDKYNFEKMNEEMKYMKEILKRFPEFQLFENLLRALSCMCKIAELFSQCNEEHDYERVYCGMNNFSLSFLDITVKFIDEFFLKEDLDIIKERNQDIFDFIYVGRENNFEDSLNYCCDVVINNKYCHS